MNNYAVAHISKLSSKGGIGSHIDRKHKIKNADPTRTHLNRELCENKNGTLNQDVEERIREGYTSNRAIRKDAVKSVGVIFTGSHEKMKNIEKEGQLDEWVKKNYKFAKDRFGEKNIIRFTLHMDEKTPHIHCVFVPIKQGKLRYKSFFNGKNDLKKFQDNYAAAVNKFGLKRGLKNSRARHTTTRQFYTKINSEVEKFEVAKGMFGRVKIDETKQTAEQLIAQQAAVSFNLKKEKERVERELKLAKENNTKRTQKLIKQRDILRNSLKVYLDPNTPADKKAKAKLNLVKFSFPDAFKNVSNSVKEDIFKIINEDKQQKKFKGHSM